MKIYLVISNFIIIIDNSILIYYQDSITIIKEVVYYNELRSLINNIACVDAYNTNYNIVNEIK